MVRFVVAFEVCMCRNPVVFLGLLGFFGFMWVYSLFGFVNFRLLCVCAYGYEGTKSVKYPLFCHF